MLLSLKKVSKSYRLGKIQVPAVQNVSMQVESGSFVTLSGPSGSGKSTLLNILGLIDVPEAGHIWFDDQPIQFKSSRQLSQVRRQNVGFIFQSFNLLPVMNAVENVMYPLRHASMTFRQRKQRAKALLGDVGLGGLEKRFPNELSGGQRQRVAVARAVARSPKLVLADEPTANLDSATAQIIVDLLRHINRSAGTAFVMATHDTKLVSKADHLLTMLDGEVNRHENTH